MTIREGFEKALAYYQSVNDTEMVEFFEKRLEQNAKKSTAERKPTAKQIENSLFKDDIVAFMEKGVVYTSAELTKSVPSIVAAGVTGARVTALLTQLSKAGKINRTEEKGKHFYSIG